MRLIKEIPQVEKCIASGELSLSNVSQAQSLFYNQAKDNQPIATSEKIEILDSLKNKSAREGQKELIKRHPQTLNVRSFEKERPITSEATEVRFLMSDKLKEKLEGVRSLLGPKAINMGYAELFEAMADLSTLKLAEKKFGKKRASATPTSEPKSQIVKSHSKNPRYISKSTKHTVWGRDGARCTNCGSRQNLNIDHIHPVALGGDSRINNLRLLCFSCNQRQAIKTFGKFRGHSTEPMFSFIPPTSEGKRRSAFFDGFASRANYC